MRESRTHLARWMPWAVEDQSLAQNERLIEQFAGTWQTDEGDWVASVWRGQRLVGGSGFHLRGRQLSEGVADVGLWVRADESGKGVGTAIARGMVDWADAAWPFYRLTWHCDPQNLASARVAVKAGFVAEGQLREDLPDFRDPSRRRDTLVLGLLPTDPRPWRRSA